MAADLLPCPWCGQPPNLVRTRAGDWYECHNRHCPTSGVRDGVGPATEAWNKRAPPLAAPATTTGDLSPTEHYALCQIIQDPKPDSYQAIVDRVHAFYRNRATPPAAPAAVTEARITDDMGSGNALRLIQQDDGDVCVSIIAPDGSSLALEVCTAQGGTRSPGVATHLRAALAAAAKAGMGE